MKMESDKQFLCKDCARYNLCGYYHNRKEESQICKNFHIVHDYATNGDVIQTMFPDAEIIEFMGTITVDIPKDGAKCRQKIRFDLDWWNAPYKRE